MSELMRFSDVAARTGLRTVRIESEVLMHAMHTLVNIQKAEGTTFSVSCYAETRYALSVGSPAETRRTWSKMSHIIHH